MNLRVVFVAVFVSLVSSLHGQHAPVLDHDQVAALRLPDVRIDSVQHHDGTAGNRGVHVAHLDVEGTIGGSIRFELLLPIDWNGRFAMGGGGGLVGSVQNSVRGSANQGYATVGTDTGHQAGGTDGRWALDNVEALVNFGHLAIHRTAEVAKAIIRETYGQDPVKSYFVGCSRGGGQAMMESQRYPQDFDGIVAGCPAFDWSGIAAMGTHLAQTWYPDPKQLDRTWMTREELDRLYADIMAQVDEQDGLKDGIIDDPTAVDFDLNKLTWLTDQQRVAIQAVYDGPRNKNGQIYPGFPIGAEGGQGGWFQWITGPVPGLVNLSFAFSTNINKYFVFNDPDWDYSTYDLDHWEKDTHLMGTILDAKNPDLSEFESRGGKLILWHAWADAALPAGRTIQYYDEVVKRDPNAADYVRLFLIPGCYHCGGGPGVSRVDWLEEIVNWVEHDEAPKKIIARRPPRDGNPEMTRPLFPYPKRAMYGGAGDPNDAANWRVRP